VPPTPTPPTMQHLTLPPEAWPLVVELLDRAGEPWPPELAALDLAWLLDQHAQGKRARAPGRPFLAARWRRSGDFARGILEAHQPSASPAPAQRQPSASPATGEPGEAADPRQLAASPAPVHHQEDTSPRPPELGAQELHQPSASPTTGQRRERRDPRQLAASPGPAGSPVITTTSTDTEIPDLGSIEGVQGEAQALGAEATRFLELYTRWAKDPKAPKRWRTPYAEALAWFLSEVMAKPEATAGINVLATLTRWGDWLAVKAEAAGKPGTATGARFPENWKNSLRNWFGNARTYAKPTPAGPKGRRGAYGGAPTTPSLFTPPTPPTGAHADDFNTWPD
jgi:hypothetical protein